MFLERAKAGQALKLPDIKFSGLIRFVLYLSLPVGYNQLFPIEYMNKLGEHLNNNRTMTPEAAVRQFAFLPLSGTLIDQIQTSFRNALGKHEVYSSIELARLLGIPEERVRGWVEKPRLQKLHELKPVVAPKPGGSGVLRFFRHTIEETLAWHLPEEL